ncbi:hypothetical protein PQD71_gp107 [Kosakonia phage Kc263]|uniref:Uncharacterized protein n=1 Tax=Kosakonia phage Kc263 TaxID=2863194 RepID=A0AAE8BEG5_9CAUD|nr:hypothetical protein PQD71_gp107 [Kosakonia phage Kc263]QYN80000.1 hypothetical protein [Kosakonia phage Kc263]
MNFGEVEHFSTMLSGCESINNGNVNSPDGRYAISVLKLHANDAGLYAGQEGFLDSVKRGAMSIVEWVKKLARAVMDWIRNVVNKITGKKPGATINVAEKSEGLIKKIEHLISEIKTIDESQLNANIKFSFLIADGESLIDKLKKENSNAGKDLDSFNESVKKSIDGLTKIVDKLSKNNENDNKQAVALGKGIKILSEGLAGIVKVISSSTGSVPIDSLVSKAINENKGRSYLQSSLMAALESNRLTIADWKENVKYVENKAPDVFDEYEVTTLSLDIETDKTKWDEDYYSMANAWLQSNFSKKRLMHQATVYDYLREKGISGFQVSAVVKKSS